jgi:hypothetical protein
LKIENFKFENWVENLPAGLFDAHGLSFGRKLAETDATDLEETEISSAAATEFATMIDADPHVHLLTLGLELLL